MNKFECSECGTKYSSPETTPPPGIKWSDGHVCTPKPVNKQIMKKILLGALLLLSMSIFAQNTFAKTYTSYVIKEKGVLQPWVYSEVTVVFNSNDVKDVIFYYPNNTTRTLHRLTSPVNDKTLNGDGFQMIDYVDINGTKLTLQLFDDDTCLRVNIAEGYLIEFHKD